MTTFARKLSVEEEITLMEFVASDDRVTYNRADSILMSANGKSTKHIALDVVLSERSVRNKVKAFNACGIASVARTIPGGDSLAE